MKTTVDAQIAGEFTQHINIARTVITGDLTVLSFLGKKRLQSQLDGEIILVGGLS